MQMTISKGALALLLLTLFAHGSAEAYEGEDAVPLTLAAVLGKVRLGSLAIKLEGRNVEIATTVTNNESTRQTVGFYAFTPFFELLGDGEEHSDKTFSDVAVSLTGSNYRRPASNRRGFFMGQDMTSALMKAGVGPLPDTNASEKALAKVNFPFAIKSLDWEGYVAYSWSEKIAANSTSTSTIRYRALPQFGMDDIGAPYFRQEIQQHCGDPDKVIRDIVKRNGGSEQVLTERYELPIKFMKMRDISVQVIPPATNWQGAHPLVSLVCGLPNLESKAALSGTVANANVSISILVISRMGKLGEREESANVSQ
jgi:hypothetical protein